MAFTCPNCAGKLYYSIKDRSLKCTSCGSKTDIEEYRIKNDAQEVTDTYGLASYVCRNCGAEILAPEDAVVSYCSYCGSEQVLQGNMTSETRPRYIIPFRKTKRQCKEVYKRAAAGLTYLPKELKDPEYLEKFRGTYIPYWMYDVEFDSEAVVKATKKRRSGGATVISTMDVGTQISGEYDGVPYDASSCFDDTMSDMIMPFNREDLAPFTPAYLAGFYADRADVDPVKYREDAMNRASGAALEDVRRSLKHKRMELEDPPVRERIDVLKPECSSYFATLLPVWFLTWRRKDRVAYAIVNGQTGQLTADFPVDLKKYSLVTLALAAVIFAIMTAVVSMNARIALGVCALLAMIVGAVFAREAQSIRDRENHVFDKGYFIKTRTAAMPEEARTKARAAGSARMKGQLLAYLPKGITVMAAVFVFFFMAHIFSAFDLLLPAARLRLAATVICAATLLIAVRGYDMLRYVQEKRLFIYNSLPVIAAASAAAIAWLNPVDDIVYYIGCIICGACSAVTSAGVIKYFNLLTTRPIPNFFFREGGNDDAEDR